MNVTAGTKVLVESNDGTNAFVRLGAQEFSIPSRILENKAKSPTDPSMGLIPYQKGSGDNMHNTNTAALINSTNSGSKINSPFEGTTQSMPSISIEEELDAIRKKHGLPGLAALMLFKGQIVENCAVGIRKIGDPTRVTPNDKWHCGSCTKSMTATVVAMLVEKGKLHWNSKIGDVFPEYLQQMDPSWRNVTIEMLLCHRGGAPHEPPSELWQQAWRKVGTPTQQRLSFVQGLLRKPTQAPAASKFIYSNQGYSIAGAMMERVTNQSWEELMKRYLFDPLEMKSAGFGTPASAGRVDQPWGHKGTPLVAVPPGPNSDNPPSNGPAGTIHCNLLDLANYCQFHALGETKGSSLLSKESFIKLHTSAGDSGAGYGYAMGWGVSRKPWSLGDTIFHHGSNTMNHMVIWISPSQDLVFIVATNSAGKSATISQGNLSDEDVKKAEEEVINCLLSHQNI